MISISRLLCGGTSPGDQLRYGEGGSDEQSRMRQSFEKKRPIVVWNCTRRCNLRCIHCYASAVEDDSSEDLTTKQAKSFIKDLSDFEVPVLLFSGGEPTIREDLFELARFAKELGMRPVISTNGTLITPEMADKLSEIGFAEIGISIDGMKQTNDRMRGQKGAFDAALDGIRECVARGQRVSLRFTINRHNYKDIPAIFDLVENEKIDRVCFYHLAYSGRARNMIKEDLDHQQARNAVNLICERTMDFYRRGLEKEILTVGSHTDGVFAYLKVKKEQPERANEVFELITRNGGNNSGIRIAAVDNTGDVHPDQFWWHHSIGNVLQRKFGDIWLDTSDPIMRGLKDRKPLLKGRCAKCQYLNACNGNLRIRAEAVYDDLWAEDPACYLTDEEIGVA